MRRFITSLPGRIISHMIVIMLLMQSLTMLTVSRAFSQGGLASKPTWVVVEFRNLKAPIGTTFGKTVAEALGSELGKLDKYDVVGQEYVARSILSLGISSPPDNDVNLFRVAQENRASSVVSGDIIDYRIVPVGSGKQAVVAINVTVYDVASQLAVNGSAVTARSTVRPSSVDDATLVNDAIAQGAVQAVREIQNRTLPTATILNTGVNTALINQGSRTGFAEGQALIILRGHEQVATAKVSEVEPDSATITIERSSRIFSKGIQPGDKVRAIFEAPRVLGITAAGVSKVSKPHKSASANNTLITAILVTGLLVALLSNGNANNTTATEGVTAQAEQLDFGANGRAVYINWRANGFAKGNANRVEWNVYRDDIVANPVIVVPGTQTYAEDTTYGNSYSYSLAPTNTLACSGTTASGTVTPTAPISGRPYHYSVELLFALTPNDLPNGGTTGGGGTTTTGTTTAGTTTAGTTGTTTGTTATNTTTGGNTGTTTTGTTGTTNTTGTTATGTTTATTGSATYSCYFLSGRENSVGTATPFDAPVLPTNITSVSTPQQFPFTSVVNSAYLGVSVEYVYQFSNDPSFPKATTFTGYKFVSNSLTNLLYPVIDTKDTTRFSAAVISAQTVYWRVGARNINDNPGPRPDAYTGQPYIFSNWSPFTRPLTPPGKPGGTP